jgi:hypothetical protein
MVQQSEVLEACSLYQGKRGFLILFLKKPNNMRRMKKEGSFLTARVIFFTETFSFFNFSRVLFQPEDYP